MEYQEVQRFSPVLLAVIAGFIIVVASMLAFGMPGQERIGAILAALAPVILIALLYFTVQLRTSVTDELLQVRLSPFGGINVPREDIRSVEVVEYRPLRDFGGWGIRFGTLGKIYSARGSQAVKLDVVRRGAIFVGSQNARRLAVALKS